MSTEVRTRTRRRSDFLGTRIGSYVGNLDKPFMAQRLGVPVDFKSSKKLHFESVYTVCRFAFYTDRGNFWGPVISAANPNENNQSGVCTMQTAPVLFSADFDILNVQCIDLRHRLLIRPVDFQIIEISSEIDRNVTFQFEFEQYTHAPARMFERKRS